MAHFCSCWVLCGGIHFNRHESNLDGRDGKQQHRGSHNHIAFHLYAAHMAVVVAILSVLLEKGTATTGLNGHETIRKARCIRPRFLFFCRVL